MNVFNNLLDELSIFVEKKNHYMMYSCYLEQILFGKLSFEEIEAVREDDEVTETSSDVI